MATFRYTAVDNDGKQIKGSLDAPSLDAARSALEDTHVEVVDLQEATRATVPPAPGAPLDIVPAVKTSYAFEGTDTTGTVRRGSIQADNKFDAFQKLKQGQKLFLTMLSPVGVTPQFRDHDLENWQKGTAPAVPPVQAAAVAEAKKEQKKPIGFAMSTSPVVMPQKKVEPAQQNLQTVSQGGYVPLTATLRLYAGWLLAWYGLFVSLGYYVHSRALPWDIPFVEAFFLSPLIFSFTVAIFLFLVLSAVHKCLRGRLVSGALFGLLGVVLFFAVRVSIS